MTGAAMIRLLRDVPFPEPGPADAVDPRELPTDMDMSNTAMDQSTSPAEPPNLTVGTAIAARDAAPSRETERAASLRRTRTVETKILQSLLERERQRNRTAERTIVELRHQLRATEQQIQKTKNSISFRLGHLLVSADTPLRVLLLPWRIVSLTIRNFRDKRANVTKREVAPVEWCRVSDRVLETLALTDRDGATCALKSAVGTPAERARAHYELALALVERDPQTAMRLAHDGWVIAPRLEIVSRLVQRFLENGRIDAAGEIARTVLRDAPPAGVERRLYDHAVAWRAPYATRPALPERGTGDVPCDERRVMTLLSGTTERLLPTREVLARIDARRREENGCHTSLLVDDAIVATLARPPLRNLGSSPDGLVSTAAARIAQTIEAERIGRVVVPDAPLLAYAALIAARRTGARLELNLLGEDPHGPADLARWRSTPLAAAERRILEDVIDNADVVRVASPERAAALHRHRTLSPETEVEIFELPPRRIAKRRPIPAGGEAIVGLFAPSADDAYVEAIARLTTDLVKIVPKIRFVTIAAGASQRAALDFAAASGHVRALGEDRRLSAEDPSAAFADLAGVLTIAYDVTSRTLVQCWSEAPLLSLLPNTASAAVAEAFGFA